MGIVYDPVNINAASGTELMMRGLEARINQDILNHFSIGRAVMLFKDHPTKRIYWTHNLPGQMNIKEVSEGFVLRPDNRWKFLDNIVFVSDWQMKQYINTYKFSDSDQKRFQILRNAIEPISEHQKPIDKIKLIYMSVPERGLDILYNVFNRIHHKYDIELEVYSSYKIYGIPNYDVVHRQLLDKVKTHPKIKYFGTVSNLKIREALKSSHIFAYPSVFKETSCISLIEAMSAECLCVHSNIAAMNETGGSFTNSYEFIAKKTDHEDRFQDELEKAINQYQIGNISHLKDQKKYIDSKYSWEVRSQEWTNYLQKLLNE